MSAQNRLVETIEVLTDCLADASLVDGAPSEIARNKKAAMLRQGLAVLVFSTIETFIRERTAEVLASFDGDSVSFSDLSQSLQLAVTVGALEGLRYQTSRHTHTEKIVANVAELPIIAKANNDVTALSKYSFGYSTSNIAEGDVKEILRAFCIDDGWGNINFLAKRIGFGGAHDSKQDFINLKKRRHSSAHTVTSTVLLSDLSSSLKSVLGICVSFDLLLSHSIEMHNTKKFPGIGAILRLNHTNVSLMFISEETVPVSSFRTFKELFPTAAAQQKRLVLRKFKTEFEAASHAIEYAASRAVHVILLDKHSSPIAWHSWKGPNKSFRTLG